VLLADIEAVVIGAVRALIAAGELPAAAIGLSAAGTWRPATPAPGGSPPDADTAASTDAAASTDMAAGSSAGAGLAALGHRAGYATSLPFELARLAGQEPAAVAARLGRAIAETGWIASAQATGAGYLTITVTDDTLASLAIRVSEAGPACARSDTLRGTTSPMPPWPDLSTPGLTWRALRPRGRRPRR